MASKEKLALIHVHTPFKLTLSDNSVQEFGKGRHNVPEAIATHWFAQAHSELGEGSAVDAGDQQALIDSLQTQITDKDTLITDLKAALVQLQDQNDSLQTQLSDKLLGGGVNTDGQKPKPANSK